MTNDALNENMVEIIESATMNEEEEEKLARQCAREYQLITRDDRLEKIATFMRITLGKEVASLISPLKLYFAPAPYPARE
ncbi:MAG: hypothetical protein V7K35_19065 [Nostoc sp.]|uniref:hypothetical protein n=1 Tax=Nostoc sp. TaxID=1180 RepID=UPI002FFC0152